MFMDSNKRGKGYITTGYFNIKDIDLATWKEFEKTIPFKYSYNHLGYSYCVSSKNLIISIHTKKSICYKLVKQWLKDKQIKYSEQGGN